MIGKTKRILVVAVIRRHCANGLFYTVRTDFWIQNSGIFPDFFQNNNFFFRTQGYQIGDQKGALNNIMDAFP